MAKRRALLLPVSVLIALVATQGPGRLCPGRLGYTIAKLTPGAAYTVLSLIHI